MTDLDNSQDRLSRSSTRASTGGIGGFGMEPIVEFMDETLSNDEDFGIRRVRWVV